MTKMATDDQIETIIKSFSQIDLDELNNLLFLKQSFYLKNVFEYAKTPSDNTFPECSLEYFCDTFTKFNEETEDEEIDNKMILKSKELISNDISEIIVHITYPVNTPAIFKYECSNIDITYGLILYLYTYSYQKMYDIESETSTKPVTNIPGMINRDATDGMFGIWGHVIGDLVYNGLSSITIYDKPYIDNNGINRVKRILLCDFDCDS
jgi:hypothetical protein